MLVRRTKNKWYLRKETRQEPLGLFGRCYWLLDLKCRRFEHEHVGRKEDVRDS